MRSSVCGMGGMGFVRPTISVKVLTLSSLWRTLTLSWLRVSLVALVVGSHWRGSTEAFVVSKGLVYCSKDMDVKAIPRLSESIQDSFGGTVTEDDVQLLQAQVIIRHGARAPCSSLECWPGQSVRWDCNVTEIVTPKSSTAEVPGSHTAGRFEKKYDALHGGNTLGGTCQAGQLLQRGYDQQTKNGRNLREAYICERPSCLFPNASIESMLDHIYLRSDDKQRTALSGQVLTANMFDIGPSTVVPMHTGDLEMDYISNNSKRCPGLSLLKKESERSPEYYSKFETKEAQKLSKDIAKAWGLRDMDWKHTRECLVSTACTGRHFPDGMTDELFIDAMEFGGWLQSFHYFYNNSAYSKLATATLTREMRDRMEQAILGSSSTVRFVLVSGHDSTLTPFLAAVAPEGWDRRWPGFASLLSVELLRVKGASTGDSTGVDGSHYFRMVYNGAVMRLKGCDQDICPVREFFAATDFAVELGDPSCCFTGPMSTPKRKSGRAHHSNPSPAPLGPPHATTLVPVASQAAEGALEISDVTGRAGLGALSSGKTMTYEDRVCETGYGRLAMVGVTVVAFFIGVATRAFFLPTATMHTPPRRGVSQGR
ncbi:unnamed protein product [Discosporangium mesarthrocarpum]